MNKPVRPWLENQRNVEQAINNTFVFRNRRFAFLLIFLLLGLAGYLATVLPLQKVPPLQQVKRC
jgi:hypothetical protein